MRLWKNIIHVAERAFVKGAVTPAVSLETIRSARFAILIDQAKQIMKSRLTNIEAGRGK